MPRYFLSILPDSLSRLQPLLLLLLLFQILPAGYAQQHNPGPDFARTIRPLLSSKCFACHGPNATQQETTLRLHTAAAATSGADHSAAVVPGQPDNSELIRRISSSDPDIRMPPAEHAEPITADEVQLLRDWISAGAPYSEHWSFAPLQRPALPLDEPGNPIDQFVSVKLHRNGLSFSDPAAASTLLRRVSLDLTGLPPSTALTKEFLSDPSPQAWEQLIDRLLATEACAERLTLDWLDVARYADTNGYSIDDHRDMWVWRDWVLHAFATNLPWNEFVRQQIAGDLLPDATPQTTMATGFLRNGMNTHEGGTIAEEYRVAAIVDKIDTVSTTFLGLTMRCAQCHDHKYDPITQNDYYRFFAFFNASSESGRGAVNGNSAPFIATDSPLLNTDEFRRQLESRINALNEFREHPGGELQQARTAWEQNLLDSVATPASAAELLAALQPRPEFPFPPDRDRKSLNKLRWIWTNAQGKGAAAWFRHQFELSEMPHSAALIVACDNEADIFINGQPLGTNPDWRTPTTFDALPLLQQGSNLLAIEGRDWDNGSKAALLAVLAVTDTAGNTTWIPSSGTWHASAEKTADWNLPGDPAGFQPASEVTEYGKPPYGRILHDASAAASTLPDAVLAAILQLPSNERTPPQRDALTAAFTAAHGPMQTFSKSLDTEIDVLRKQQQAGQPTVMVMDHSNPDRATPMLLRGQYNAHGDTVTAGIPVLFGSLPEDHAVTRLDLANWLVDPTNPLTARVAVNRYWQLLFGAGLVETTEDFGFQGSYPSHPELLNWLAAEFVESGWDLRHLLRTMLLSRTYQQSSRITPELREQDPANRLLARASRYRLQAELIRDQALAIGGLLHPVVGGPSVYPSQPSGLWKQVSHYGYLPAFTAQHYFPDQTKQLRRRSMYTFWKRTAPPPAMMLFDAPNRETCVVRRDRTNTPLQALVLLNSSEFAGAAAGLAERMALQGDSITERLQYGFLAVTSRPPSASELQLLQQAWDEQHSEFRNHPEQAQQWLDYSGVVSSDEPAERATMVSLALMLLNLDESLTRE